MTTPPRAETAHLLEEADASLLDLVDNVLTKGVVIDGEIVGTWRRTAQTREVVIDLSPFRPLPDDALEGLAGAVLAYGGQPVA